MNGESGSGKASDGGQDLVGGFGPAKRFRLLVVYGDEFPDGSFQFLYAAVRSALDLSLGKQREPTFDLIEP